MRSVNTANSKIVLISPPTRAYSPIVPFPCIYLAAFLEKNGFFCEIVDIKTQGNKIPLLELEDKSVSSALNFNTPCIGFTCLSAEYPSVRRMALDARKRGYKGRIIVGGHHPTFYPQDFIFENSPFDYVVLGEGEMTLYELLLGLENNGDIAKIPGVAFYRDGLFKTEKRALIEDLDILPIPSYGKLDMDFYLQPRTSIIRYSIFSGVDVQTTRGCPHQCTYCGNPTLWSVHNYKKRFRCRSISNVLDELQFLYDKYRIDSFFVNDDSFTISEDRVSEFCNGLKEHKLNSLIWGIQTRANIFTENMAKNIAEAGCVQVEFGVESGSARILKLMKKGITLEQVKRAYNICHKYKLRTFANFMINTPTETEEDLDATIKLAKELKATHYGFFVTVPLPGTEIYKEYVNPPLTTDEYSIYLGSQPYKQIIDSRFKLASHKKNIALLAIYFYLRFTAFNLYLDPFFSLVKYSRVYLISVHKKRYIRAFFDIYIQRFIRHFLTMLGLLGSLIAKPFINTFKRKPGLTNG